MQFPTPLRPHRRSSPALLVAGLALIAVLSFPVGALALGHPGGLDPTFHGGTPVIADLTTTAPRQTRFGSILVDAAGRIVVSGATTDLDSTSATAVARFDATGSLDPSFGVGGSTVRQLGSSAAGAPYSEASGVFAMPGGNVGFGVFRRLSNHSDHSAFVIRESGGPNLDFGSGGLATRDPGTSVSWAYTAGAAAGADGSVYVAGSFYSSVGESYRLALTKFAPSGQVATSFGTNAGTWIGSFSEHATERTYGGPVIALPGDRVLVGGSALLAAGRNGALLARFSGTTGQPDALFGDKPGRTLSDASDPGAPVGTSEFQRLAIAPDGSIYGAGVASDAQGHWAALVMRFTPLGRRDTSFGVGGVKRFQLATGDATTQTSDIAIQSDGRILLLTFVGNGSAEPGATRLLRINSDGTVDQSFGRDGVVDLQLAPGTASTRETYLRSMTISSGRLLLAGNVRDKSGVGSSGVVARVLLDALPDPSPVVPAQPAPPQAPTQPPFDFPAPAPGVTKRVVNMAGARVTFTAPSCIPRGGRFTLTLSSKTPARKRASFVRFTRVDFSVDRFRPKPDLRAPFTQRLTLRPAVAGSRHTLRVRAFIRVRRGTPLRRSLTHAIAVCA